MNPDDILVIGAGPAGLAVAACLHAAGLPYTLVEREAHVAATWRRHYDRLHLHTTRDLSTLPHGPWPTGTPTYPSREQVVAYLDAYAARHGISPRVGVTVEHVRRDGDRFTVRTDRGTLTPRVVVFATGTNAVPVKPDFPDLENFAGSVTYAATYRNPAPYGGKRTLVVGSGNSGAEIALDLAEHGVEVSMVVRGPVHVVPRDVLGRPSQATSILLSRLPIDVRDRIVGTVMRLAVGDLSRYGIRRPTRGLNRTIVEDGRIPMLDIGTVRMIRAGRIRVLPAVQRVHAADVTFADGRTLPFDALILATGYRPGLEGVIDGYGALSDDRGRPRVNGGLSGAEGLYFVGYGIAPTGVLRTIAQEAPRVAALVKRDVSA
ncbi:pyruvate/2-oxoglutarate dehydrogenase complex dihydrolipoamide dehydrogenase (E3) component [Deinococcus metalli]|uniref:Dimethylaniline monooxygenase n=1 Tax=Deinococcus metalli TaxID=1141878 RepID=A0A7W8KFL3_9DEIO|nr:NAD(P)/FAD-dependent oxidoreductase [Deinococcus metalli]MBB5375644.1 pyruvate/2-oxoglutarate dehydrogenase complex dihydrolipoamide dehydrogenase (E3) component [Deinococcus metalli]GHF38128.1 dimethylaniline monooxygenase [Deinococcus metalli]